MSDVCKLETIQKFSSMTQESIDALEQEIARLQDAYKGDLKKASPEMKEIISNYVADEKYTSVRVIADKIKNEQAKRNIIVKGDVKKTINNFLNFFEANDGIENTYRTFANSYGNMIKTAMMDSNLQKEFYSGDFDELIFKQAYNKANNLPDVDDAKAVKMYEIIKKTNDEIHKDMVAAGLNVRYRRDFLISRNYKAEAMVDYGKPAWIADMKEKYLNLEETFSKSVLDNPEQIDRILDDIYEEIVKVQTTWRPKELVGVSNSFNKLKGRKFQFKDGSAEYNFHQQFGNGKRLGEAMEYQIDRNAKTIANNTFLGTNAQKSYLDIVETIENEFRGKVPDNELKSALTKVNRAYQEVVAPAHAPSTTFNKAINMIRGLQAFTKLGSSIFAAAYDANSAALQYAVKTGETQFTGYAKAFKKFAEVSMTPSQRKELGRLLNVNTWFNDAAVVLGGHRGDYDTGFDKINRFFTSAQKFTGVPYQTEISRVTNALLQADAFTKMVDGGGAALNSFQKQAMEKFKLSTDDFALMKKYMKKNKQTETYVPMDVLDIPDEAFGGNAIFARKKRNELFRKFSNYIDESVQAGTPTPTARVKRHLLKDRSRDETTRAVASLVMQFKETTWKIALSNKEALDTYYRANGVVGAGMGVAQYMTLGMVSYMGFETLKAAVFDKESPYDKLKRGDDRAMRDFFFDYLNKSSVAPLLTDAVDQGTSPYFGNNITSFIAGPTL